MKVEIFSVTTDKTIYRGDWPFATAHIARDIYIDGKQYTYWAFEQHYDSASDTWTLVIKVRGAW